MEAEKVRLQIFTQRDSAPSPTPRQGDSCDVTATFLLTAGPTGQHLPSKAETRIQFSLPRPVTRLLSDTCERPGLHRMALLR